MPGSECSTLHLDVQFPGKSTIMNARNALTALGCLLVMALSACSDTKSNITANQRRASELIQAINTYTHKHGQFPDKLDDLTPEFIDEIPTTVGGRDFDYFRLVNEYVLSFDVTNVRGLGCGYSSYLMDWECSFGAE